MKAYIEALRKKLIMSNLRMSEISEIISDYKEMIRSAMKEGLGEAEIVAKFGEPQKIASELAEENNTETVERKNISGFQLWESFDISEKKMSVNIRLVNGNIYYQTSNSNTINVYFRGELKTGEHVLTYKKGRLKLMPRKKLWMFNTHKDFHKDEEVIIELPKGVIIDEFRHHTVNGGITIMNLETNKIKIRAVNGHLKIIDMTAKRLGVSQVNGDAKLVNTKIRGEFRANTVNGNINLKNVDCHQFKRNTVNGNLIGQEFYPQEISFSSLNGRIAISNQEKHTIKVKKIKTLSGDSDID